MSRVGRKIIEIPSGISVEQINDNIIVRGANGEASVLVPEKITVTIEGSTISISRSSDAPAVRSVHGLIRALIFNAIQGIAKGFEKRLTLIGVGYRAEASGAGIRLFLGYSHHIDFVPPQGVKLVIEKNQIVVSGNDKQVVGQVAANIRAFRKPEPYKGKGIRYADEVVHLKPGKAGKATSA